MYTVFNGQLRKLSLLIQALGRIRPNNPHLQQICNFTKHFHIQEGIGLGFTYEMSQACGELIQVRVGTCRVTHVDRKVESKAVLGLVVEAMISNRTFGAGVERHNPGVLERIPFHRSLLKFIERHTSWQLCVQMGVHTLQENAPTLHVPRTNSETPL